MPRRLREMQTTSWEYTFTAVCVFHLHGAENHSIRAPEVRQLMHRGERCVSRVSSAGLSQMPGLLNSRRETHRSRHDALTALTLAHEWNDFRAMQMKYTNLQ